MWCCSCSEIWQDHSSFRSMKKSSCFLSWLNSFINIKWHSHLWIFFILNWLKLILSQPKQIYSSNWIELKRRLFGNINKLCLYFLWIRIIRLFVYRVVPIFWYIPIKQFGNKKYVWPNIEHWIWIWLLFFHRFSDCFESDSTVAFDPDSRIAALSRNRIHVTSYNNVHRQFKRTPKYFKWMISLR